MKIEDSFRVSVPVEEAWNVLLDVERIAPCMPGAQLQEVEGDEYRGIVKVKVGPISAQYKGAARIVEADEAKRKVVIKAEGRDTRGQGNASATVTATLTAGTAIEDLNIVATADLGNGQTIVAREPIKETPRVRIAPSCLASSCRTPLP